MTEHNSEHDDDHCPEERSDKIIEHKLFLVHLHTSGDEWHKSTSDVMKSSKNHENTSSFANLLFEVSGFRLSESDRRTVLLDEFDAIFFSEPVSNLMTDKYTKSSNCDETKNVMFSEK
jgi:hypothetical protein